ncbi:MAG: tetratricopeptide repeat protein, partial [Cyanobium sp.]
MSDWRRRGAALVFCLGLGVALVPVGVLPVRSEGTGGAVVASGVQELLEEGDRQWMADRLPEAMATFSKALALARQTRDRQSEVATLNNIGIVQSGLGQPQEALKSYHQALLI